MIKITKDLNPFKEYSFQTSSKCMSLPMTVKQFLNCSHAKEKLIAVDEGLGPASELIWSTYDGWNVQAYSDLVCEFVGFIDKTQDVNPEFIDSAIEDELSVYEAVSSWFECSEISLDIDHHLGGESGLLDIDIQGIYAVRRVVISINIKKGDMFNIYYEESSKGGGTWDKDLVTTLKNYFQYEAD
jgi:hypothetical protein